MLVSLRLRSCSQSVALRLALVDSLSSYTISSIFQVSIVRKDIFRVLGSRENMRGPGIEPDANPRFRSDFCDSIPSLRRHASHSFRGGMRGPGIEPEPEVPARATALRGLPLAGFNSFYEFTAHRLFAVKCAVRELNPGYELGKLMSYH